MSNVESLNTIITTLRIMIASRREMIDALRDKMAGHPVAEVLVEDIKVMEMARDALIEARAAHGTVRR